MWRITEILLLAAGFLAAATFPAGSSFEEIAAKAAAARAANDIPHAIELYQKAVQLNPQWQEGWWYLGTLAYDSDQYKIGEYAFEHLVRLDEKSGPGWALLGLCEFETGNYAKSLADLEHSISLGAVKDNQMGAVVLYHEALALSLNGRFDEALRKYATFVRYGSMSDSILLSIGIAALRERLLPQNISAAQRPLYRDAGRTASFILQGDYRSADQSFVDLLAKYPNTPHVHYLYGVYMMMREPNLAIEEFQRELKIDPANADALTMLALSLVGRGDSAQAVPWAQQAAVLAPDSSLAQSIYGRALVETGDYERGLKALLQAEHLNSSDSDTHISLAVAYAQLGRLLDARREREIAKTLTEKEIRDGK